MPKANFFEPYEIYWSSNGKICVMCYSNIHLIYKYNLKTDKFVFYKSIDRQVSILSNSFVKIQIDFAWILLRKYILLCNRH